MSFKKYRLIDLSIIIVIGIITECLGTFLSIKALPLYNYSPYAVVALGLICLAVTRYGIRGAITIPVFALANSLTTYIVLKYYAHLDYSSLYYVARSIGCLLSLASPLILLVFYKNSTNEYLTSVGRVAKISAVTAIIFVVIIYISAITNGFLTIGKNKFLDGSVFINAFAYALAEGGLGILFMFAINIALYKNGTFKNSYETLVNEKVVEEVENEYYSSLKQETDDFDDHQAKGL